MAWALLVTDCQVVEDLKDSKSNCPRFLYAVLCSLIFKVYAYENKLKILIIRTSRIGKAFCYVLVFETSTIIMTVKNIVLRYGYCL